MSYLQTPQSAQRTKRVVWLIAIILVATLVGRFTGRAVGETALSSSDPVTTDLARVVVSRHPLGRTLTDQEFRGADIDGMAKEMLVDARNQLSKTALPPSEKSKLAAATSAGRFVTAGGKVVALVTITVDGQTPIAVITGPVQTDILEVYCSDIAGGRVSLHSGACDRAIRENFGGPING